MRRSHSPPLVRERADHAPPNPFTRMPIMRMRTQILVADDNPDNLEILRMRLSSRGYDVITAADGEEALAIAKERQPDLILLDVMMPRLDGVAVCQRLRADPRLPFTPI